MNPSHPSPLYSVSEFARRVKRSHGLQRGAREGALRAGHSSADGGCYAHAHFLEMTQDLLSIVNDLSSRLYGLRKYKKMLMADLSVKPA